MRSSRALITVIRILSIPAILILTGCHTKPRITLYPMAQTDIFSMETGKTYTAPKNGWFVSDFWMKKVGDVKVEAVAK
jgi:hypothetical protein